MNIKKASQGFAAAGAEPRLGVLMKLVRVGPNGMTVVVLQESLKIPSSTLAHHLRCLSSAGLIVQKKKGRRVVNIANFIQLRELADFFLDQCCADSDVDQIRVGQVCC